MTTSEEPPAPESPAEVTKITFRKDTWTKLQAEGVTTSSNIFLSRIPYFKGTDEAAQRFSETEEFLKANTICINADKAQEKIQYFTVQAKKTLLIQIPALIRNGLVKAIKIPDDLAEEEIKKLTNRTAIGVHGKTVPFSEDKKVDIVVMGSIAVSKEGQRIGKGDGYADLEYAMMSKMGMLTPETIVVTTVHDSQVYDTLPKELFKEHEIGVDLIVTPTQVIRVSPRPSKSSGIKWSLLSNRRLKIFPALRQLHEKDMSAGDTSELKEDSDVESRPRRPRKYPPKPRYRQRPDRSAGGGGDADQGDERDERDERAPRPRRPRRLRPSKSEGEEDGAASGGEGPPRRPRKPRRLPGPRSQERRDTNGGGEDGEQRPRRFPRGRPRPPVDFSLRVSNIASDVRVRDLKNALAECKVKPVSIKWRGQNGFALLHFARTGGQVGDGSSSVDTIMTALRELKVSATEGNDINIEPMNAVTRIEVTDEITSV